MAKKAEIDYLATVRIVATVDLDELAAVWGLGLDTIPDWQILDWAGDDVVNILSEIDRLEIEIVSEDRKEIRRFDDEDAQRPAADA
jgi:hypothetical protein